MTDTLWYTRCPVPTAFSLAVRNGWLDDEFAADGITIQSLATSTDPKVRQAHFDQTQPNFFRHGGNIPPLVSRSRGTDVRLIGLSWTETSEVLLALPGSGIDAPADLRGKRLSLPKRVNASIDFWRASVLRAYETALELAGLTTDDVEFVELDIDRTFVDGSTASTARTATLWDSRFMLGFQREESRALLNGTVDVIFAQGGNAANVQGITGGQVVVDLGTLPTREQRTNNSTPLALTVTGDLLDERPDLVARVMARTLRSADWARNNPGDAARIVAGEVGVAEDLLPVAFSDQLPLQLAVDLSDDNLAALRSQADLLDRHGFLAAPIDWDAFVDHGPLAAARELLKSGERVGAEA
jgi:ABC-type nitrate/sulfonate/bicarbonate transport system substrate-binding protein